MGPACTCTTRDPDERATRCAASSTVRRSLPTDRQPQAAADRRAGQQLRFRRAGGGRHDRPHRRVDARQDVRDRRGVFREPGECAVEPDEDGLRPGRAHVHTDRGARVVACHEAEPNGRGGRLPSADPARRSVTTARWWRPSGLGTVA